MKIPFTNFAVKKIKDTKAIGRGHMTLAEQTRRVNSRPAEYDELVLAYQLIPCVQTSVDLVANTVAGTRLRPYFKPRTLAGRAASGDYELAEVTDENHPANTLISQWSQEYDEYNGKKALARWIMLTGGGYLAIIGDVGSGVGEIQPLMTTRVWPVPNPDRDLPSIVGYRYGQTAADASEVYELDDIIRFGTPSPADPTRFHSCFQSAINEIRLLFSFTEFQRSMLERGGIPGSAVKGFKDAGEAEAFREMYERVFEGTTNAERLLTLEEGLDIEFPQISKELGFLESAKQAEDRVYRAAGIPRTLLEQENSNLAGAARAPSQFVEIAVNPILRQIEDGLNAYLAPRFGGSVCFKFDPVNAEEPEDTAVAVSLYNGGLLTQNEARARVGADAVEGGDEFYSVPSADPFGGLLGGVAQGRTKNEGNVQIEESETLKLESPQVTKSAQVPQIAQIDTDSCVEESTDHTTDRTTDAQPTTQRAVKYTHLCMGVATHCCTAKKSAADDAERDLEPTEGPDKALSTELQRTLSTIYDDAARIVGGATGAAAVEALVIESVAQRSGLIRESLRPILMEMVTEGYAGAVRDLPESPADLSVVSDTAVRAMERRMDGLIQDIGETTGRQVGAVMQRALSEGASPREAAAMIRQEIPNVSRHRAETIAQTETSKALLDAREQAWADSGMVEGKTWRLSANPCPVCIAIDQKWTGKAAPLGEPFVKAGETLAGVTFDRDIYNTAHPRCRCSTGAKFIEAAR